MSAHPRQVLRPSAILQTGWWDENNRAGTAVLGPNLQLRARGQPTFLAFCREVRSALYADNENMGYVGPVGNQADKQATFRFKRICFQHEFLRLSEGAVHQEKTLHARERELPWSEAYSYIPKERNI